MRSRFAFRSAALWAVFFMPSTLLADEGGDILIGEIEATMHWTADGPVDGVRAYSLGTHKCNDGVDVLDWVSTPSPSHPVTTTNLYRLHDGRFEHIGMSWVFHQFFALQSNTCGFGCVPECAGNCLGTGCSSENSATFSGQRPALGPRSDINAHLGTNPGVFTAASSADELGGRLQVHVVDTDPFLYIDATYFVEAQSVAADDAQSGDMHFDDNNASYRPVFVDHVSGTLALTDVTHRELPAIYAWQADDPQVELTVVDIPDEGRLILGSRVTDLGGGQWHYEYALYNMNSDRGVGAVSVPIEAGHTISNIGFHDVDYHSGELYDGTDWTGQADGAAVTWATTPFAVDPLANALRWGTLYNFRFVADAPPVDGMLTLGLFKPGPQATVTVAAPAPAAAGGCTDFADCADLDGDGIRDDNCRWWSCSAGACAATDIRFGDMGGPFGACAVDGAVDGNDRFHALNCFSNVDVDQQVGYPCEADSPAALNVDAGGPFGACAPDGVCDGSDAFHALNAFEGTSPCSCPLDGAPAPAVGAVPLPTTARLDLHPRTPRVSPGELFAVDVVLASPLADLRGYQLHVTPGGGRRGSVVLRDIAVRAVEDRGRGGRPVFGGLQPWSAFNLATRQMVVGLDRPGIAVEGGYLATFIFAASPDAAGAFVIELDERTYIYATDPRARIDVRSAAVRVEVR